MSGVYDSRLGRLRFRITAESDGTLEIVGTPEGAGEPYYRRGPYSLEGGRLTSPILNEGQPVTAAIQNGGLTITIDETLAVHLRQE